MTSLACKPSRTYAQRLPQALAQLPRLQPFKLSGGLFRWIALRAALRALRARV